MHATLARFGASLLIACSLSTPALARRPAAGELPVRSRSTIDIVDIEGILTKYRIRESVASLVAVTADKYARNMAFFFVSGQEYSVYRNGDLLTESTLSPRTLEFLPAVFPSLFAFTPDGHLLYSVNPTELFFDDIRVSDPGNTFSYASGNDTVHYAKGLLTYPETSRIQRYDTRTGKRRTLYEADGFVQYMRGVGGDAYYTVFEKGGTYFYKNGEKITDKTIDNAANFKIAGGHVYFFTTEDDSYTLWEDDRVFFTGKGRGAAIFSDPQGYIWHVSSEPYTSMVEDPLYGFTRAKVWIYENGTLLATPNLGNMEGWITFKDEQFAARVALAQPGVFHLLRNGKLVGKTFGFDNPRDGRGIVFAKNGKTYMRNSVDGRWVLFDDGKPTLNSILQDVYYVDVSGPKVRVYGTMDRTDRKKAQG